jgi:hypothetical protein
MLKIFISLSIQSPSILDKLYMEGHGMSLFPCRVCERPVGATAKICPGCYTKLPAAQTYRRYLLVRYIIPGLLLLGGVLYWWIVLLPALKAQFLDH